MACARKLSKKGFTLLELLIAMVLLAILLVIAYPSYQAHMIKVRRVDGQKALINMATSMEKTAMLTNQGYSNISLNTVSPEGYYQVSVVKADMDHFVLAAFPRQSQQNDKSCGVLAIDDQGRKGRLVNNSVVVDRSCW